MAEGPASSFPAVYTSEQVCLPRICPALVPLLILFYGLPEEWGA